MSVTTTRPARPPVAHPGLRVSDGDRERAVEEIKTAFADGRLDKAEMDERLQLAMSARTAADLRHAVADLRGPARPRWTPTWKVDAPVDSGDRVGAAAAHLLTLCGLFMIGPLIMLMSAGRHAPYIRGHAIEALNFHLTVLGATLLLPITIVGILLLPVVWVLAIVLPVVGGCAALLGREFRYPLTVRLVR